MSPLNYCKLHIIQPQCLGIWWNCRKDGVVKTSRKGFPFFCWYNLLMATITTLTFPRLFSLATSNVDFGVFCFFLFLSSWCMRKNDQIFKATMLVVKYFFTWVTFFWSPFLESVHPLCHGFVNFRVKKTSRNSHSLFYVFHLSWVFENFYSKVFQPFLWFLVSIQKHHICLSQHPRPFIKGTFSGKWSYFFSLYKVW